MTTLLEEALVSQRNDLRSRRLADGEINALEYYVTHQMAAADAPMAQEYILRAIAELRAVRQAGVIVHVATTPPPEVPDPTWIEGKWGYSTNEEVWDSTDNLDSEAEAIEHGKAHAEDMGLEFGRTYFTGRISPLTPQRLAGAVSAERVIDDLDTWLYDNIGEVAEDGLTVTPNDVEDLDRRLTEATLLWLVDRQLTPSLCTIERVQSHIFERCEEEDTSRRDPANHPRCTRFSGHDGAHEFEP